MPSSEQVLVGSKMLPAVRRYTQSGRKTDELRPSSAHAQPLTGAKIHGGHCCMCGVELDAYSHESSMGVCDQCVADPKINQGRWEV